jgi:phosphatidylinositol N-acetylglucosaminyltransferase subunit P
MAEHTPAPTASRSIYGFVVFLLFTTLFILYVLWAFIPLEIYESIGITELPNKYFALFLPILILTATTIFAFFIYPSFSFIMTSDIDSINTITDSHAIRRCQHRDSNGTLCDNKIQKPEGNIWNWPNECDNHENRESRIFDHCDCKEKEKCMLGKNDGFIDRVRKRENSLHSAAGDLDIYYVSQLLYSKRKPKE